MSEVVFKLIILILQGVEGLVFNMPTAAPSSHHEFDITLGQWNLGNPRKIEFFSITNFPIIEKLTRKSG